ncbi:MAG: sulfotransferase, partial [Candidatus Binatia bacterium]
MNLLKKSREAVNMARTYLSIAQESRNEAPLFSQIETYCAFIGYPRSGHSIVGAMLDAHPQAVIAHEMGALHYVQVGFDRLRLYHLLLQNTRAQAE